MDEGMDERQRRKDFVAAVQAGNEAAIAKIALAHPDLLSGRVSRNGETALSIAAQNGRAGSARVLLEAGADPNARDNDGSAPLHRAGESPETMRLLLAWGADPCVKNRQGQTILFTCDCEETIEIAVEQLGVGRLEEIAEGGRTPLLCALADGREEAARALLARGANLMAEDWNGEGAINACVRWCGADMLKELLDLGASGKCSPLAGPCALAQCILRKNETGAAMILAAGADPNRQMESGTRVVTIAVAENRQDLAEKLVRAGASLSFKDREGLGLRSSVARMSSRADLAECDRLVSHLERLEEALAIGAALADRAEPMASSRRMSI